MVDSLEGVTVPPRRKKAFKHNRLRLQLWNWKENGYIFIVLVILASFCCGAIP